ncbi:hypothetical protein LTR53_014505, partial [Teratosphaeriaceae sp. CCFEE 6253]
SQHVRLSTQNAIGPSDALGTIEEFPFLAPASSDRGGRGPVPPTRGARCNGQCKP